MITPVVLRERGFRRYWIGQSASLFGDSLVPLTIAFAALQVAGPVALGLVLAANQLPVAVLVLLGGVLGDRWSRNDGAGWRRGHSSGTSSCCPRRWRRPGRLWPQSAADRCSSSARCGWPPRRWPLLSPARWIWA
ncbi:hypothetical protein MOQ72_42905 [Saccharopolyspora sp. K220]|uniref:hypothetical protein n=1 Tax=Saccharopolyspora soli TaxID=2926618 RepID=UPI001F565D3E|nr:hypothetical protein [Saccharopolyspora soli]MCI2424165.1 hypothetical protein [Saccharopolyspora soli]